MRRAVIPGRGAAASPEPITADFAGQTVRVRLFYQKLCSWVPGSAFGRPGMTAQVSR